MEWQTPNRTLSIFFKSCTPLTSKNPNTVLLNIQIEPLIAFHESDHILVLEDTNLVSQIKHSPYPTNPNTTHQWLESRIWIETRSRLGLDLIFELFAHLLFQLRYYRTKINDFILILPWILSLSSWILSMSSNTLSTILLHHFNFVWFMTKNM